MKKSTKMLSLVMCVVLTLGLLTGCGNSNSNSTPPQNGETGESSSVSVVPAKSFKYVGISTGVTTEEFNAHPLVELLEEHTGYDVTYDQVPGGIEEAWTMINNIFINREDYQAINVTKDQFYSLLAQDALKDLSPYIENSKNLKNVIGEFGWETVSKDGGIYALPRKDAMKVTNWAIAYREDWLKEYNAANPGNEIPVPSEENGYSMSVSDFRAMLEYFKTKVPQGGAAFHVDMNAVVQEPIMPAFGIYNEWMDVDGKLTYYIDHPNFEAYLTYMQALMDDGLVAYSATAEEPNTVKMLQADQLGAGRVFHWDAAAIEGAEGTDDSIGYISALVADEDKGDLSKLRQFSSESYQFFTVVPKYATEEQAAAVVDWGDKTLDEDFFRLLTIGEEGKTFTVKDGEYWPILPEFNDERNLSDRYLVAAREEDYSKYWLCRTRKTEAQNKLFSRANANIETTGVKSPIAVMPPNEAYDTKFTGAKRELDTALVTTMFGTTRMSVDELRKVFAMNGGAEVTESVNEWYATWESKDTYNTVK